MTDPSWTPIAEGLWSLPHIEGGVHALRSTAVAIEGGALVYSALQKTPEGCDAQLADALGDPAVLLVPNHFHNLGLDPHRARFPDVQVCAAAGAHRRVSGKTRGPVLGLEPVRERLPPGVSILEPQGSGTGEVWLRVETPDGVAWVVGDAFVHYPQAPRGAFGLVSRMLGIGAGLQMHAPFKFIALRDRPGYRDWLLGQLVEDPPSILVPSHGDPLVAPDLGERLAAVLTARIPE